MAGWVLETYAPVYRPHPPFPPPSPHSFFLTRRMIGRPPLGNFCNYLLLRIGFPTSRRSAVDQNRRWQGNGGVS